MSTFESGQQVYIKEGRYCRRHATFVEALPLQKGFCLLRLYNRLGEVTNQYDIVPINHIRPVTEYAHE
jgi:hypothetical protein